MPSLEPVTLVVTGRSMHDSALLYRPRGRMRNGRWQVPKSAPPQLTRRRQPKAPSSAASVRTMRVASAYSTKSCPQKSPRLSVDDVYFLAERTRMRTSQESRQLVLAKTQRLVRNDSGMSRPQSELNTYRTLSQRSQGSSRNSTSRSRVRRRVEADLGEEDEEEAAPGFVSNVEISLRPRVPSLSGHSRGSAGQRRLGSAVTIASTYLGSEFACASPRPEEPEARKMSVARQCCEVMGPGVCRDCHKLKVRLMDRERMEADFPRLRVSEKNVTTSAIVKRVLPDMTQAEIQDKIARGEIARSGLLFPRRYGDNACDDSDDDKENDNGGDNRLRLNGLHGKLEKSADDDENEADSDGSDERGSRGAYSSSDNGSSPEKRGSETASKRSTSAKSVTNPLSLLSKLKLRLRGEASTPLYFMDLRHQNAKIVQGQVSKNLKAIQPRPRPEEEGEGEEGPGEGVKRKQRALLGAPHLPAYPAFVSPRKLKAVEEPAFKVYFDPPLLAKHQQVCNPSFFAGSDDPYFLPERLPDVIEFADGKTSIVDPGAALRSESSLSFVSGVSEETAEQLSSRAEAFRASKVVQEPVQE